MLILLRVILAFATILDGIVTLLFVLMIARAVLSFVRVPANQITYFVFQLTEPILRPFRRRIPVKFGIDFSFLVVFLILIAFRIIVIGSISDYAFVTRQHYLQGN